MLSGMSIPCVWVSLASLAGIHFRVKWTAVQTIWSDDGECKNGAILGHVVRVVMSSAKNSISDPISTISRPPDHFVDWQRQRRRGRRRTRRPTGCQNRNVYCGCPWRVQFIMQNHTLTQWSKLGRRDGERNLWDWDTVWAAESSQVNSCHLWWLVSNTFTLGHILSAGRWTNLRPRAVREYS